jgi:hopanoid biosynthesis associated RND transporter like protein HpnN
MLTRLLPKIVDSACRRPWVILMLTIALAMGSLLYIATHFAMTTDSSALISPNVDWRLNERRMDAAFPQNGDSIAIVIDGATPELAEGAASRLTAKLIADHAHFKRVTRPDGGDFFAREGLLFGTEAEVSATTARMIEAQPFLGPLAADPSLGGIAGALGTMIEGVKRGDAKLTQIDRPMVTLSDTIDARLQGKPAFFSWQALLGGTKGDLQPSRRRLILVTPVLDYGDLQPGAVAAGAVRSAAKMLAIDPAHGATVRLTGSVPLSDEEFASLADKAWLVAGTMIAAMLLTLWLATRSVKIVGAIMVTTITGLFITTALGLAVVGQFNLISVAFIPLFVGLGVDFGIQIGVRFQAENRDHADMRLAIAAAVEALGPSLLLAAGAVCLGFLAFLPTAYVGIAELGIIAGLGMIVALAFSITLLPALIILLKPRRQPTEAPSPALAALDDFLLRRRRLVLVAFAVSMVLSIASLLFVRFDFNPLNLRAPNGEAMATLTDLMRDPDRNPNTIDILAPNLNAARALASRLTTLPEVGRVLTVESFVPIDQVPKLATIADARTLLDLTLDPIMPMPPAADAETVLALQQTAASLQVAAGASTAPAANHARRLARSFAALAKVSPADRARIEMVLVMPMNVMLDQMRASLTAEPATLATLPALLRQEWIAPDGAARIQLFPRGDGNDNATLARFTKAVRKIAPEATGVAVSTQAAAHTVAMAFVQAGALAFVIISLLLFMVLRDIREVAFTLAPVVLSGFLTLGTCVAIGQSINFANIIAFPLLFGVGVAFHIYFVMAWRNGATNLLQSSLARAVFFSALATGSGFGSLWLSSHPGTASMGKILMISLAWTLICALIFEPALLGPPKKPGAAT